MPMRNKLTATIVVAILTLLMQSCYQRESLAVGNIVDANGQVDTVAFSDTHHYAPNYNFIVVSDSMLLMELEPERSLGDITGDTLTVYRGDHIVVADIAVIDIDSIDNVWIQLARDEETIGWTSERNLLRSAAPDNLVSRTINMFSGTDNLLMWGVILALLSLAIIAVSLWRKMKIVHWRDIDSFYPTLLALLSAAAAVLFSSIQQHSPELWQHFYFHPSLNPFSLPLPLGILVAMAWTALVVLLATIDVVRHLPAGEAFHYVASLIATCVLGYVLFSILTYYYIGYPLLAAYIAVALYRYFAYSRARYICGKCGQRLHRKGICPHCGASNV